MRSIRRFQILTLVAGSALITAGIGWWEYRAVRRAVYENLDASILARASALASLTSIDPEKIELEVAEATVPQFAAGEGSDYFQVWIGEHVLARSESLFQGDLPRRIGAPEAPRAFDLVLPDGRRGRAVGVAFPIGEEEDDEDDDDEEDDEEDETFFLALEALGLESVAGTEIVVAVTREPAEAMLASLVTGIIGVSVVFAGLLTGLIWLTISAGLSPLRSMAREIGAIDERQLKHRVGGGSAPNELAPIADSVNAMLERLEVAWAKEQRVTASIAHELRTPIAEMQSAIEVAERWPSEKALSVEAMETIHESIARLTRLAEAVRTIHQATDADQKPIELDVVRFEPVVERVVHQLRRHANGMRIEISRRANQPTPIRTCEPILELVLNNLVDNAIEHSHNGEPVRIDLEGDPREARLTISNSFDRESPPDLTKIAEPYWRSDQSRTNPRHVGLGLTVVESVAPIGALRVSFAINGDRFKATVRAHRARRPTKAG